VTKAGNKKQHLSRFRLACFSFIICCLLLVNKVAYKNIFTTRRVCIARTMPWLDVCPSVTRRYFVETAKHIKVLSPSGSQSTLFFPYKTAW